MPTYSKTVRAFLAQEGTVWNIVDALTDEMPDEPGPGDIAECRGYLAEHGIEKPVKTIRSYRYTGRYVAFATADQRKVLRGQAVETIATFATSGASQEAAVHAIRQFQEATGKTRMNHEHVRSLFRKGGAPPSDKPEDFDSQVVTACKTVLRALNMWQRGDYEPSVEAIAQLSLIKPADLDAELAALLTTEG